MRTFNPIVEENIKHWIIVVLMLLMALNTAAAQPRTQQENWLNAIIDQWPDDLFDWVIVPTVENTIWGEVEVDGLTMTIIDPDIAASSLASSDWLHFLDAEMNLITPSDGGIILEAFDKPSHTAEEDQTGLWGVQIPSENETVFFGPAWR